MYFIIKIGIALLNVVYAVMKCLPVQNKIVYISRQMDEEPLDFVLLKEQMEKLYPQYTNIIMARMIKNGFIGKLSYCFYMLRQMYHIVTARAVILDTYCILISVLRHRKSLAVIQMWHALGAFKKFGYSVLDKKEGSSTRLAKVMHMHKNYSYVLTSSAWCRPHFAEAFCQDMEKVKIMPLPRVDVLLDRKWRKNTLSRIYACYPALKETEKEIIVYAPTFRKGSSEILEEGIRKLADAVDYKKYKLVLKVHPLCKVSVPDKRIIVDKTFSTQEMFNAADYIVTDYSAVIFEAALLGKPLFFYAFDYEEYAVGRDFYFDYKEVVPGMVSKYAQDIVRGIEEKRYSLEKVELFKNLMVETGSVSCTETICRFVNSLIISGNRK